MLVSVCPPSGGQAPACFARTDHEDNILSADEIMRATAANLHGEFATVLTTAEYIDVLNISSDE